MAQLNVKLKSLQCGMTAPGAALPQLYPPRGPEPRPPLQLYLQRMLGALAALFLILGLDLHHHLSGQHQHQFLIALAQCHAAGFKFVGQCVQKCAYLGAALALFTAEQGHFTSHDDCSFLPGVFQHFSDLCRSAMIWLKISRPPRPKAVV